MALFFVVSWFHSYAQSDVDYHHKSIYKAIEKKLDMDDPVLSVMTLSGSSKNQTAGSFYRIADNQEHNHGFVYIGRVFSCKNTENADHVSSEFFDHFTLYDTTGQVQQVKIFNYQATHGHEVTVKGWLKQFIGYNGNSALRVGKDIDGISGATISVHTLTHDIEIRTGILSNYLIEHEKCITNGTF